MMRADNDNLGSEDAVWGQVWCEVEDHKVRRDARLAEWWRREALVWIIGVLCWVAVAIWAMS